MASNGSRWIPTNLGISTHTIFDGLSSIRMASIPKACKQSLKKLGVDYLDLYLIHWPGPKTGWPLKKGGG